MVKTYAVTASNAIKTASKKAIQKIAEATGDLIRNKIAGKISRNSPHNTSETVESETEIPKERKRKNMFPEKKTVIY